MIKILLYLTLCCTSIQEMGDNNYNKRQEAYLRLLSMGESAIPFIEAIGVNHEDLEISDRSNQLMDRYHWTIKPSKRDKMPWIDCLPKNYPDRFEIINAANELYRPSYPEIFEDPIVYRYYTHEFFYKLLKNGANRKEVIKLLDKMVENEDKIIENGGRDKYIDFDY